MPLPIRPNSLLDELRRTLSDIEAQTDHAKERFELDLQMGIYEEGTTIWDIRDRNGQFIMLPLLIAKTQCLSAIVQLTSAPKQ